MSTAVRAAFFDTMGIEGSAHMRIFSAMNVNEFAQMVEQMKIRVGEHPDRDLKFGEKASLTLALRSALIALGAIPTSQQKKEQDEATERKEMEEKAAQ